MRCSLLLILLCFCLYSFAQDGIDSAKLDSLKRSIGAAAEQSRLQNEQMLRDQDSMYRSMVVTFDEKGPMRILEDYKQREAAEKRRAKWMGALAAFMVIFAVAVWWRDRRRKKAS